MRPVAQKVLAVSLLALGALVYCAVHTTSRDRDGEVLLPSGKSPRLLLLTVSRSTSSSSSVAERAFDLTWLHDKKKQTVAFDIVECHDKPPFDLCLDLKDELRGNRRLWSFSDDEDMSESVPQAKDWRASIPIGRQIWISTYRKCLGVPLNRAGACFVKPSSAADERSQAKCRRRAARTPRATRWASTDAQTSSPSS